MKKICALTLLALGCSLSAHAGTVYIGFKDMAGPSVDYDYNDLVFAVSGTNLNIISDASWSTSQPILTANGAAASNLGLVSAPYWNNTSYDGPKKNIGWCIYGGGNCNDGVALGSSADYLTTDPNSSTASPDDVLFHSGGTVTVTLLGHVAESNNNLGFYPADDPSKVTRLFDGTQVSYTATFRTVGDFGLVGWNELNGQTFFSRAADGGTGDAVSHFAYFATVKPNGNVNVSADGSAVPAMLLARAAILSADVTTPEPGTLLLLLTSTALIFHKRRF